MKFSEGVTRWHRGFDGCTDPYDLGYAHGVEDGASSKYRPRPGCILTRAELAEYRQGYDDGRRGN